MTNTSPKMPGIRYDKSLEQKPSLTARAVYQHVLDEDTDNDGKW